MTLWTGLTGTTGYSGYCFFLPGAALGLLVLGPLGTSLSVLPRESRRPVSKRGQRFVAGQANELLSLMESADCSFGFGE